MPESPVLSPHSQRNIREQIAAPMKTTLILLASILASSIASGQIPIRPPAVPLVACDPYFSIWSPADKLTDANTTHWTGRPHRLSSSVTIDGQKFRLMGADPVDRQVLPQKSVTVSPTRSIYQFESAQIALSLTFMTPSLPEDIDLLSWPVTYVTYSVKSVDRKPHRVSVDFDVSTEITTWNS